MKKRNAVPRLPMKEGETIRIVLTASCPTLSNKGSTLGYQVGVTEKGEPQLRISSNSGSGTFSSEWQRVDAVRAALDRVPKDKPVSAAALEKLYSGSSQNSPFFLLACLKHLGFVVASDTKRCYARADAATVDAIVKALVEEKTVDDKPKKKSAAKTAPAKSPSAATKKAK